MKKLVLVCALFAVQAPLFAQQTVPNVGFESWQSTPYDEPNGWISSNPESFRKAGTLNSTKVTGYNSDYAISLETVVANGDTAGAFVVNNGGKDPLQGEGGVPYSQMPATIKGYYKYTPGASGDSAILIVLFKKFGQLITADFYKLGPAASFTNFSFPINFPFPITPDSVIIGAASSNLIDEVGIADGSVLVLDELAFDGIGITQAIPNGNFETWTTKSFDRVNGWDMGGEAIARTNDKHNGTYAVMLQTTESEDGNANPTQITSGQFTDQGPQSGGQAYSRMNDTLVGWYKFAGTLDSAEVMVTLKKNGNVMQGFNLRLAPAANYTPFSLPLNASQQPDSMVITISSSKWPASPTAVGSTLTIDDVQLKSEIISGIGKDKNRSLKVNAFPNPAADQLTLMLPEKKTGTVHIYDMTGKQLISQRVSGKMLKLDIQSLNSGMYIYELSTDSGEMARDRFIKQ